MSPAGTTVGAGSPAPASTENARSRISILLVDDQPARLLTYEAILSGLDIECVRANSGREALKLLLSRDFALILLDVNMPEMDGFETARLIRDHPRWERTPIIFVTGISMSSFDQLKGYEVGAIDYISVPIVPEILRTKVMVLVALHQRRRHLEEVNTSLARARTEQDSRHASALALLDNAPVALAHNSLDGKFEYVNRAFCKLMGYSAPELYGRCWQNITHPEDVSIDRRHVERAIAGDLHSYTVEKRCIRKDGSIVWVNVFGNFVADEQGRPLQEVAVVVDITEQRSAAAELNRRREQLILAHAAAYLGMHDWDVEADTISWDERTREIWGSQPSEDVSYATFISGLHPEDRARTQAAITKALDPSGDGHFFATFRVINHLNHRMYWVEANGRAMFRDALAVRLIGTVQDVTDRIHAQHLLQESEARFREANERKDEFLSMLSHELRNPAAAIGNAAQALSRLVQRDKERVLVDIVERQIRHLGRLLDDLLDVSHITRGRIELQRERLTLQSCVEHALETTQPLIAEKQLQLTVDMDAEPIWVNADRARFTQCIANVLTNAAKYTEPGGEIHVRASTDNHTAIIDVTDTGIGMPSELTPHVFELFAQGERTLDRSQGGLGIGLAVCRMLMEMQGGNATGSSPGIGRGSTFTLRMPLAGGLLDTARANDADGPARVLVVDDNRDAADSLALLLQLESHATQTAYSSADALARAAAFDPHFVLLDIGLPEMDGYEVARRLKAIVPEARLIAITGYGLAGDKQRSASSGFEAHLVKPVSLADIQATFAALAC
jgi:PAS domain S-box-containing protein